MSKHLFLLFIPPVSYIAVFLGFVKCQERREDGKVNTTLLVDGGPLGGTLQRRNWIELRGSLIRFPKSLATNENYWIMIASLKSLWTSTNT